MDFTKLIREKPDIHYVLTDLTDKKIISDWNYNGEWGSEEKHLLGTCSFYNHELRYFLV